MTDKSEKSEIWIAAVDSQYKLKVTCYSVMRKFSLRYYW